MTPSQNDPLAVWRYYVAAGETRDYRQARLAECPQDKQEDVREWVIWFMAHRGRK